MSLELLDAKTVEFDIRFKKNKKSPIHINNIDYSAIYIGNATFILYSVTPQSEVTRIVAIAARYRVSAEGDRVKLYRQ